MLANVPLKVGDGSAASAIQLDSYSDNTKQYSLSNNNGSVTETVPAQFTLVSGNNYAGNLVLNANSNGNIQLLNGNVGIGTTGPTTQLNIGSNGSGLSGKGLMIGDVGQGISTSGAVGSEIGRFEITFPGWRDVEPNQIGAKISAIRINNYQNNLAYVQSTDLAFSTGTGTNGGSTSSLLDLATERMRIQGSTGNVGIGTTNPGNKLTIQQVQVRAVRA